MSTVRESPAESRSEGDSGSARRTELLEASYGWLLEHGVAGLSLRPLAADIGSSPRVLLYLFGSKEGLIRELLARARRDELAALRALEPAADLDSTAHRVWSWLAEPRHRAVNVLWLECYARSLTESDGPWSGFADATVRDWLELLGRADDTTAAEARAVLALVRGALLDLLATGDRPGVTEALESALARRAPD